MDVKTRYGTQSARKMKQLACNSETLYKVYKLPEELH